MDVENDHDFHTKILDLVDVDDGVLAGVSCVEIEVSESKHHSHLHHHRQMSFWQLWRLTKGGRKFS